MQSASSSRPAHMPGDLYTPKEAVSVPGEAVQSTSGEGLSDLPSGAPDPDSVRRMVKPGDVHDGKDNIELESRTVSALNDGAVASQNTILDLFKSEEEKIEKDLKSFFRGGECPRVLYRRKKQRIGCDAERIKIRAEEYATPAGEILFCGRPYALVGLPGCYYKIKVASPEELAKVTKLQADFVGSLGSDDQDWKEKSVKARDELLKAIPSSDDSYIPVSDMYDFYTDDISYIEEEANFLELTSGILDDSEGVSFDQVVCKLREGEEKMRLQLRYAKHGMNEINYGPSEEGCDICLSWVRLIDLLLAGNYDAALECKNKIQIDYNRPR